jgi:hypothetical protein
VAAALSPWGLEMTTNGHKGGILPQREQVSRYHFPAGGNLMPHVTKADLVKENDFLKSKLEEAQEIISDALDYEDEEIFDDDEDEEP